MSAAPPSLELLQRWMQAVVTDPGGVETGLDSDEATAAGGRPGSRVEELVAPTGELSSVEHLRVYSNMYVWRLVDILRDDFPTTAHVLGERFYATAQDFLTRHPSRHPNLTYLSAGLSAYLRDEADVPEHRVLVSELAHLERVIDEVFAAEHAEPVAVDDLLAVPQERWAAARLATIPGLRLCKYSFPINAFVSAVRRGDSPEIPTEPDPIQLVVWRKDWTVWRLELSPARFETLSALQEGQCLGDALARAAALESVDESELAGVGDWFREWTGEGMFRGVALD